VNREKDSHDLRQLLTLLSCYPPKIELRLGVSIMKNYNLDFLLFGQRLGEWFKDIELDQSMLANSTDAYFDDLAMLHVIENLNKKVFKDPGLLEQLYHCYQKELLKADSSKN
jgi:hypothetical protein